MSLRLSDALSMRAMDDESINEVGIPGVVLMENAGRGTYELMKARWGRALESGTVILCGRGNNGGDGFVIARHLYNAGLPVKVILFARKENVGGDAAINLTILRRMGIQITELTLEEDWKATFEELRSWPFWVDALLGTGLMRDVGGMFAEVIKDLNQAHRRVVAVDIPSGLDAVTGHPRGTAVRAEFTASFGLAKIGLAMEAAIDYVGELEVVDISLPRSLVALRDSDDRLIEASDVLALLPERPRAGHKGSFGHLAVVAGSVGKAGAAILASHAALRSGVGLVTLFIPSSAVEQLSGIWPEVMVEPVDDGGMGRFTPCCLPQLIRGLEKKGAMALGPGLSTGPGVTEFVAQLVEKSGLPLVIDADGLNALIGVKDVYKRAAAPIVLTPHPSEAARQLGRSTKAVQADRCAACRELVELSGGVAVLKGARSLVGAPSGRISVNPTGNSGMGTAGTGDLLTGLVGGLLAQAMDAEDAAVAGVYLHGLAGDLAAAAYGERAMVAGDLCQQLGQAFCALLSRDSAGYHAI